MSGVRFGLLGPFEVSVDDGPVLISSAAERALLTLLLLTPNRSVSATTLIDRLWDEESLPVDPTNALQLRVSKLRRTLAKSGLPIVYRENQGYRINASPDMVDAELFVSGLRRARGMTASDRGAQLKAFDDALGLWRGEALSDFVEQSWATPERVRLEELRRAALTERAQLAISLGRESEVIAQLEPLVAADPTQEAMAGILMIALYRAGRQAEALEVYTRTRALLDDHLGLEPSTSLRSLHERVLRQDASLGGGAEINVPTAAPLEPASVAASPKLATTATAPPAVEVSTPDSPDSSRTATATPRRLTGAEPIPTNLPAQLTALIGREAELEALHERLGDSRLVTLVGPGGAGKTALAITAAAQLLPLYPDGVHLTRLSPVRDTTTIATAIADAVRVPLDGATSAGDISQRLLQYLRNRHTLLVIDNCEHVIDAAATLIEDISLHCPGVTVLATSREALAVAGEVQVPVAPLASPPLSGPTGEIARYPASQLFIRRAEALRPGLTLDDNDLLALSRVCRALDGMPLALELAAARTTAMSLTEIAERLDNRFTLLTTGTRTAEDRQRTLRATVDWSYDLLTPLERDVFERLSVFQGVWTLDSAEAVVADADVPSQEVLHSLARLVEQSLVVASPGPTTTYRMLETLREYAADQLATHGHTDAVKKRHAHHFRDQALVAAAELRGHRQAHSLRRLREHHDDIRAALAWFEDQPDLDEALQFAGALGLFWHLGRHLEGREVLRRLLVASNGDEPGRAGALQALSLVERPRACIVHPNDTCAEAARESLEIFQRCGRASEAALSQVLLAVEGVTRPDENMARLLDQASTQFESDSDKWGQAVVDFVRMEAALKAGEEDDALQLGRRASEAFRALDDFWGLSAVLYHLGWGLRQFGRHHEARDVLDESIAVALAAGMDNTAQWALADLGLVHVNLGDLLAAKDAFHEARRVSEQVGDGAGTVLSTYGHALIDQVTGNWNAALAHFTNAIDGFADLGTPVMRANALIGRSRALEALDDLDAASALFAEAVDVGQQVGEPSIIAAAWEGLARLAQRGGDPAQSQQLSDRAAALRVASHRPIADYESGDR